MENITFVQCQNLKCFQGSIVQILRWPTRVSNKIKVTTQKIKVATQNIKVTTQ